jgi:hypothetical protein
METVTIIVDFTIPTNNNSQDIIGYNMKGVTQAVISLLAELGKALDQYDCNPIYVFNDDNIKQCLKISVEKHYDVMLAIIKFAAEKKISISNISTKHSSNNTITTQPSTVGFSFGGNGKNAPLFGQTVSLFT